MYIKQITISGFKSYRDVVIAGPFVSSHNVVVGRNGSGKSNFFDAVRFVLSDQYSSLSPTERVALLHEGAGSTSAVISGYVEIVFDNADGRLPGEKEEVKLRRMIGLKKDEYLLDRKNVTRAEVFNLLESAGFSKSNPYYIVQQGKVSGLCAMSDQQRLQLLMQVAGTKVYDDRRNESINILQETDAKRAKIDDVIKYIDQRLSELDSEKEELTHFQALDKERKAIEYSIYVKDLAQAKTALEQIQDSRDQETSKSNSLYKELEETAHILEEAERNLETAQSNVSRLIEEKNLTEENLKDAQQTKNKLALDVAEVEEVFHADQDARQRAEAELAAISEKERKKNEKLQQLLPKFDSIRQQEETLRKAIQASEEEAKQLRLKATRKNFFQSATQRDDYLQKEIHKLQDNIAQDQNNLMLVQHKIDKIRSQDSKYETEIQKRKTAIENENQNLVSLKTEHINLNTERSQVQADRHAAWRNEAEIKSKLKSLEDDIIRQQRTLRMAMGNATSHAIEEIMDSVKQDPSLRNSVYGPLYELINVKEKFIIAVDVSSGGSLSNIVVDTDETASKLVSILLRKKAGRLTFIPLSIIESHPRPQISSQDAVALIGKISVDNPVIQPVIEKIFAKTLVVRDVRVGADISKTHNMDCVTLDGDQVNRRGAMTGGFIDNSRGRLQAAVQLKKLKTEKTAMNRQYGVTQKEIQDHEAEMARLCGEIQKKQAVQVNTQASISRHKSELEKLYKRMVDDKQSMAAMESHMRTLTDAIDESKKAIETMRIELGTPLLSGLSDEQEQRLNTLLDKIEQDRETLKGITPQRSALETKVNSLKNDLENNIGRQIKRLKETIQAISNKHEGVEAAALLDTMGDTPFVSIDLKRNELEAAEAAFEICKIDVTKATEALHEQEKQIRSLRSQIEEFKSQLDKLEGQISKEQERMEALFNKRSLLEQNKTEQEQKIRELGALPSDVDKFASMNTSTLMKKLEEVNKKLKKYSNVNKKALEQFMTFADQRDNLLSRRDEIDKGGKAIRDLINSLDVRKDQDILRTFKGVSKNFSEVFAELVPGGKASLIMIKSHEVEGEEAEKEPQQESEKEEDEDVEGRQTRSKRRRDEPPPDTGLEYVGVAMRVSFTGGGKTYMLQQLSGGQKSIVALALIFAIQRLDPAPFYLFDEIDANLDATHRQSVANLIKSQSLQGTQFITTTFRPEFVNAGDLWFGVTHRNKISSVNEVSKEDALAFITEEPER